MNVVVVGASGFLGAHVLVAARARGHAAIGTQARARRQGLARFDLRRDRLFESLPAGIGADGAPLAVVLCAAITQPDRCAADPTSWETNVAGMQRAASDTFDRGGRVLFLSTGFVFDGARGGYREDDAPAPLGEYGRQKLAMERWLLERPDTFIARVDKLIGDDPRERHLFREWQDCLDRVEPLVCLRGQEFSPTSVDDVATGLVMAAETQLRGLWHLAGPDHVERDVLARSFCDASGRSAEIVLRSAAELGMREPRPLRTWLDGSRFASAVALRFTPMDVLMRSFLARLRETAPTEK